MGLDQWILRNDGKSKPDIDDNGDWVNVTECIQLRKEYWLRNILNPYVKERTGRNITDLCAEFIPISRDELLEVTGKTKRSVRLKDELEVMDTYRTGMFYSNHDFDWCIMGMSDFNRVMCNRLRSDKETQYYYFESW